MKNGNIFQQFWFVRSNYNSKAIPTCCSKSNALPHEKKKEMDQDRILMYSRVNSTLRRLFVLLDNS